MSEDRLLDDEFLALDETDDILHHYVSERRGMIHSRAVRDPTFLAFRGSHFLSEAVFLGGMQKYTRKVAITICYRYAGVTEG